MGSKAKFCSAVNILPDKRNLTGFIRLPCELSDGLDCDLELGLYFQARHLCGITNTRFLVDSNEDWVLRKWGPVTCLREGAKHYAGVVVRLVGVGDEVGWDFAEG